jgi:hypothetical protein
MKTKLGRPEMPQGKANNQLIHLRVSGEIAKGVDKAAASSYQGKPEWMRDALEEAARNAPVWVRSKWKAEELDGQLIEFDLNSPKRRLWGIGKLAVRENPEKKIRVDIFIDEPDKGITTRIWLAQEAVDKIELNPKPKPGKFILKG